MIGCFALTPMAQRWKLKNARWRESDQQVRVIVDLILDNVMAAIDFRATAAEIVSDIVDDAMSASDDACSHLQWQRSARSIAIASLRRDWLVMEYRLTHCLPITNPLTGRTYALSLRPSSLAQLKNVGYDIKSLRPGTTKHVYAALRAAISDLPRSASIRIWYTNADGAYTVVLADEMPAIRLVGMNLFVLKLWCSPKAVLGHEGEVD